MQLTLLKIFWRVFHLVIGFKSKTETPSDKFVVGCGVGKFRSEAQPYPFSRERVSQCTAVDDMSACQVLARGSL